MNFLKLDQITQNSDSSLLAIVYQDNGKFGLLVLDINGKQKTNI